MTGIGKIPAILVGGRWDGWECDVDPTFSGMCDTPENPDGSRNLHRYVKAGRDGDRIRYEYLDTIKVMPQKETPK
jgi:hypothetical protein